MKKLVTIIIPTYRRPFRLKSAILSAINQTYNDIEIIIVDDNDESSSFRKETEKIVSCFFQNSKIKYIRHKKHGNGAIARNTGIKNAKGELITFLDDDDSYLAEKVEKQVNFLESNPQYNAIYCGRIEKGKIILPKIDKEDITEDILMGTFFPCTSTIMIKKNILEAMNGFNESFLRFQDLEFSLRYFDYGNKIGAIYEPLVVVGQNVGENDLHGDKLEEQKKLFLDLFSRKIIDIEKRKKNYYKKTYISNYVPVFFDHITQGYLIKAIRVFLLCIKLSPFYFISLAFKHIFAFAKFIKYKYSLEIFRKMGRI